jgi:FHA domain
VIRCPVCKHEEYEGTLYCSECGNQLWEGTPRPDEGSATTQRFGPRELAEQLSSEPQPGEAAAPWTGEPQQIIVRVQGNAQPIYLQGLNEYKVGRGDPKRGSKPDLDLGPFRALEMGVSREHALLKRGSQAITVTDLGSTNGTTVNGVRLAPNSPQALRDGDELRLGKLTLHVFFESG